ncbi:MAG: hypothetical protein JKY17_08600 [Magnetovibrio sp.]|nr:hypothetical protein [Magnetovibrio sp.]
MSTFLDNQYIKHIVNADTYILIGFGIIGLIMLGLCILATEGIAPKTRIGIAISMFFTILVLFVSILYLIQVWSIYIPNTSFFDDRYLKSFKNIHPLMGMGLGIIGVIVLAYSTSATKKLVEKPKTRVGLIILMSGPLFALAIPFIEMAIIGIFILAILGGFIGQSRVFADAMLFDGDIEKMRLARKFRNFFN